MQIRRLFKTELDGFLANNAVLVLPTALNNFDAYRNASFCAVTSLAGIPSVTMSYMGTHVQLCGANFSEGMLWRAAEALLSLDE